MTAGRRCRCTARKRPVHSTIARPPPHFFRILDVAAPSFAGSSIWQVPPMNRHKWVSDA